MFFQMHPEFAAYESSILSSINGNIEWLKTHAAEIIEFAKANTVPGMM